MKERQNDPELRVFDGRQQQRRNMRTGELQDANTPEDEAWKHFRATGDQSNLRELGVI